MNEIKSMGCQGDVMFRRVQVLPDGLVKAAPDKLQGYLAAHSETGHNHTIDATGVVMFESKDPLVAYLQLETVEHADVVHRRSFDTHATVRLGGGQGAVWEVRRQREYDPAGERRAAD